MPQVTIDGQVFDIPADEITGQGIKTLARIEPENVLYIPPAPGGAPVVIDDQQKVRLREGDQIGTVRPFLTGREG